MRLIKDTLASVLLIFVGATVLIVRLNNPTLTETQLFMNFYPLWLLLIILISVAYTLFTFKRTAHHDHDTPAL